MVLMVIKKKYIMDVIELKTVDRFLFLCGKLDSGNRHISKNLINILIKYIFLLILGNLLYLNFREVGRR